MCMGILESCRPYDHAADQDLKNLTPLYERLVLLYRSRSSATNTHTRAHTVGIPHGETESLRGLISASAEYLLRPFDGGVRLEVQSVIDIFTGFLRSPMSCRSSSVGIGTGIDGHQSSRSLSESISTSSKDGIQHYFLNDSIGASGFIRQKGAPMNRMPSETRPHMTSMKEVFNDGK